MGKIEACTFPMVKAHITVVASISPVSFSSSPPTESKPMKVSLMTLRLSASAISSPNEAFVICTTEGVRKKISWPPLRIRCLTTHSANFPRSLHVETHQIPKTFVILDENASGQHTTVEESFDVMDVADTPLMLLCMFAPHPQAGRTRTKFRSQW